MFKKSFLVASLLFFSFSNSSLASTDFQEMKENVFINEIIDKSIGIFGAGIFFLLVAGILSLLDFLRSKAKGNKTEEIDEQSGMIIASKTRRLINFSVDQFFLINGLFTGLMLFSVKMDWYIFLGDIVYIYISWFFIIIFYYFFFEALFSKTPGKFVTGTKVLTKEGKNPGAGHILARTIIRFIPFEMFSFLGNNPFGWHDRWTDTIVVRSNYQFKKEIEKEQKIKGNSRLAELNKQKWFRTLKIAYLLSISVSLLFSFFYTIEEFSFWDDASLFFLACLFWIFIISELAKRVFYYIYFGKSFLKEDFVTFKSKK